MNLMEARPPYVRFEMREVEDRPKTIENGRFTTKSVPFVVVQQLGATDSFEQLAEDWFQQLKRDVQGNRLPAAWLEGWQHKYDNWRKGEEVPPDGTSLKLFPLIQPDQVRRCIDMGVRTVEDLAVLNADAAAKLGVGGLTLVQKAQKWLQDSAEVGKVLLANEALEKQVADQKRFIEELQARLEAEKLTKAVADTPPSKPDPIDRLNLG